VKFGTRIVLGAVIFQIVNNFVTTRTGSYEIQEAEGVQDGTKIVLHLKTDHRQFSDEDTVMVSEKKSIFVLCQLLTKALEKV